MKIRLRATIEGRVQGVGFRPFVHRLAGKLGLAGWVNNSAQGVRLEVEGERAAVEQFLLRLNSEKPPRSSIQSLEFSYLDAVGYAGFEIRASDSEGALTALVMPDIATCADCLREIFDPTNRRYRYPFTNCTNCGPRFTIIEALPYDRPNTTMKRFTMCPRCRAEYENSNDRRFHAQPNACPDCGPRVEFWNQQGKTQSAEWQALADAAAAISDGALVAVKGIGGFQLLARADREDVVARLRERKHREEKPLALMFPSLDAIKAACAVSPMEQRLLLSPEAPIVLLRRRSAGEICESVAPNNPYWGAMLPYSPLHHLLMSQVKMPVVATSGNLSDEPICIDELEAVNRLKGVADYFLTHNRPIARHADDSVARLVAERELVLRRARGYAPLPVVLKHSVDDVTLAVGAHLKNSVALAIGKQVFISQHIGDLETAEACAAFANVICDFQRLYQAKPTRVAADLHPDYHSTAFAAEFSSSVIRVQHHYAHALSCMAENELEPSALAVAWDGTGYGADGTIWGGEFSKITDDGFQRVAHLRAFRLPGGDRAVREPRRSALGLLHEMWGDKIFEKRQLPTLRAFSDNELANLWTMLEKKIHSPLTTSAGRLFDAVASLIGLRQQMRFEGQAAMELEFVAHAECSGAYDFAFNQNVHSAFEADWEPMIRQILNDVLQGIPTSVISAKFHNALVELIVNVARQVGESRVLLTGGCFQNQYLTERAIRRLEESGFRPYWHQRVPPNDGGIALGQIVAAACLKD